MSLADSLSQICGSMRDCWLGIVLGMCAVCGANRLPAQETPAPAPGLAAVAAIEETFVKAIEQAEKSIVSIARYRRPGFLSQPSFRDQNPFRELGLPPRLGRDEFSNPDYLPSDFGSGVILAADGPLEGPQKVLVLTNYHVVYGGMIYGKDAVPDRVRLSVTMHDGHRYAAWIYAADPRCDLAVLIFEAPRAQPIKLGTGTPLKKGQLVLGLGNPYASARDGSSAASWGIISNLRRRHQAPSLKPEIQPNSLQSYFPPLGWLITVDMRLDLGTSGGALINLQGELIGLTTSLAALEGYEKSVGYAIALDAPMLRIIDALREGKEVDYGFLGIKNSEENNVTQGVRVAAPPVAGGPAALASLQMNDLILAVNGQPVRSFYDLNREVGMLGPDVTAQLSIRRGSREVQLPVELTKWPVTDEENLIATNPNHPPFRGLVVDYSTARQKYSQELLTAPGFIPPGVLILDVQENSTASRAELIAGQRITHVNQQVVRTPGEFVQSVQGAKGPVTLRLQGQQTVTLPE